MSEKTQNAIENVCDAHGLKLLTAAVDHDVVVLTLVNAPEPQQSVTVAAEIKRLGHRWVAFEVAP